jgi:uncharacterized membrane protein
VGVAGARLLVVSYADAATAERSFAALSDLADETVLVIEDAAVVVRNRDGDGVRIHQERSLAAGEGVVGGGTVGLLLGLALGIPIIGAIVGMTGGAGAASIDTGIPDDELRRIGETLARGEAALLALVAHADWARVRERLGPYGGEIVASEVAEDVLAALTPPEP